MNGVILEFKTVAISVLVFIIILICFGILIYKLFDEKSQFKDLTKEEKDEEKEKEKKAELEKTKDIDKDHE